MSTKIKPSFKSEFERVSEGYHLFRVVEPRIDLIKEEDRKETKDKEGVKNDKNYIVRSAVEGGEEDGIEILDFFPNHSTKEFGLSRLAGLMIKTEALPATDEIDVEFMRSEKFETKFKMSLPKRLFGGRVKHTPSREDKEKMMQNVVEYLTVKEYNEKVADLIAKGSKTSGKGSTKGEGDKTSEKGKETPKGKEEDDPWKA